MAKKFFICWKWCMVSLSWSVELCINRWTDSRREGRTLMTTHEWNVLQHHMLMRTFNVFMIWWRQTNEGSRIMIRMIAEKLIISWSKSSRNSFRKFKIQVLFIKNDIVPFKVLSIDCNALMPALDPALETFLELYCCIAIRAVFDFFITSFQLLKRVSP